MENSTTRLLCVGDLNADITVAAHGAIVVGSDTPGDVSMSGGGSGANVASWAVRSGCPTRFAGVVGDDALGDLLVDELVDDGVDAEVLRRADTSSRAIVALIGPDGERSMVSDLDSGTVLRSDDVDSSWFDGVDWLHLTAYTYVPPAGRDAFAALVALADERSIPWSLDPSSSAMLRALGDGDDRSAVAGAFDGAAVMFPNDDEATWLAGVDDAEAAAEALLDLAETVVVTSGADGALLARRGRSGRRIAAEPVELVNTLGCGDAFAAGFLAARLAGADDDASARRGAAVAGRAASIATSR